MMRSTAVISSVGRMNGTLMSQSCCHGLVPSTTAASDSSLGNACSAARIITAKNGTPCHTSITISVGSTVAGWATQGM